MPGFLLNPETLAIIAANDAALRLYGYQREEILKFSFRDLNVEEERNRLDKAMQESQTLQGWWKHRKKDGGLIYVEHHSQTVEAEGKKVLLVHCNDVTLRREAMNALRDSEEAYRRIVELSPDAITVISGGNVVFANMACEKLFKVSSPDELWDKPFEELVHADFRPALRERARKMLEENQETPRAEMKFLRADKTVVDVEVSEFALTYQGKPALQVVVRDITQRKTMERALKESEERYKGLVDVAFDGVAIHYQGVIKSGNRSFAKIFQYEPHEIVEMPLATVVSPDHQDYLKYELAKRNEEPMEIQGVRKDGSLIYIELCSKTCDFRGKEAFVTAVRDISERKKAEEAIRHQAYFDTLTGLPNRLLFHDRLSQALEKSKAQGTRLAVMFLDLDRFKLVNDSLGHNYGDLLLQQVASRLSDSLKRGSTVSRLGGDEFTILLAETDQGEENPAAVAKRILESVAQAFDLNGHEAHLGVSIGISLYPEHGEDAAILLKKADTAMYRAKDSGRNNVQIYNTTMDSQITNTVDMENSMRHGIEQNQFELYFQPQLDLATGTIVAAEALLRWNHPEKGLVMPDDFIPLAEESRLILPLGEWVIQRACDQNKAWQDKGLSPITVSVNLSAFQFHKHTLVFSILKALKKSGLAPKFLELEITESVAMKNAGFTLAMLQDLAANGLRLALDDFGKGYSSLNYLKKFPIHCLKIDQSFVADLETQSRDASIVNAMIILAHNLNLEVVAEGVERKPQMDFLRTHNCDRVQGYYFSKPLPVKEFEQILISSRGQNFLEK